MYVADVVGGINDSVIPFFPLPNPATEIKPAAQSASGGLICIKHPAAV